MEEAGILIGIDLGTTALKAAAFRAADGTSCGHASRRLPVHTEPDGTREQDTNAIRAALAEVFGELRDRLGQRWAGVCGIGLAAQGGSATIVDRKTAEPHTPMMLWNDSRPSSLIPEIQAMRPGDYWQRLSWRNVPGAGLARMRWLKARNPELFAPANLYTGAGELAYFLLTDTWRQDACNALQMGCYHVAGNRLDAEPLTLVDVPLDFVAPLRNGHEMHPLTEAGGRLLGLAAGIPVAGPYMDHEAGYLSAAALSERPLQCSLGTAWVGNFVVPEGASGGSPFQLVIAAPHGCGRLVIQPLLTGNVSWDWGLSALVSSDHDAALRSVAEIFQERLLPAPGLICLPWFTQMNVFDQGVPGAGAFLGISPHTDRRDLVRALVAGLCYEFMRVFEHIAKAGVVDSVVLGGGASKGAFFRKILTALFHPLPVFPLQDEDLAGARGTLFAFDRRVARSTPGQAEAVDEADRESIAQGFRRHKKVFERLYGHVRAGGAYEFPAGQCPAAVK